MLSYMLPIEAGEKGPANDNNNSNAKEGSEEEAMGGGVIIEEDEEEDLDVGGEHRRLLECTHEEERKKAAKKPPMVPTTTETKTKTTTNEMSILINSPDKGAADMDGLPTTHGEHKPKPKLILNGTKQPGSLKRVSFGSSKGSMVETLIFESPLQEEPETSPIQEVPNTFSDGGGSSSPFFRMAHFPGSAVPHPHSLTYTTSSHIHHNGGTISSNGHHYGSEHSSSSPHGVGSPPSGAIAKVTSASSSLSSASTATAAEAAATSKVRVTFFESEKPHVVVGSPEPALSSLEVTEDLVQLPLDAQGLASGSHQQQLLLLATTTMTSPSPIAVPPYDRQTSNDSGWDNPFRPDGDLSREADEIVELIKGGKPITPTPGSVAPPLPSTGDTTDGVPPSTPPGVHNAEKSSISQVNSVKPSDGIKASSSPKGGTGANGNAAPATTTTPNKGAPSSVEVQRGVVPPGDACQAEHVVLKKKPKCKCCVIQ